MSRPIKFRGWWFQQKKMDYPSLQYIGKNYSWPLHWCKLMQFTGLHDKNGKEIWEGDILDGGREVKLGEFYAYLENGLGGGYHITGFYYKNADDICVPVEGRHDEVLGNIYENPELLK